MYTNCVLLYTMSVQRPRRPKRPKRRAKRSALGALLGSEARARVLGALLAGSPGRYYVRDLARRLGLPPTAASRELGLLTRLGLTHRVRDGGRVYFEANAAAPVLRELRGLVLKLGGIADALRAVLAEPRDRIRWAFLYGSTADGTAGVASDIDLFVVGDIDSLTLHEVLGPVQEMLGREVSTFVVTPAEFRAKRAQPGGFVERVLGGPRIDLIGDERSAEAAP